jgi:hypothetical protein
MEDIKRKILELEVKLEAIRDEMNELEGEYFMTGDKHERNGIELELMHLENKALEVELEIEDLREELSE